MPEVERALTAESTASVLGVSTMPALGHTSRAVLPGRKVSRGQRPLPSSHQALVHGGRGEWTTVS